MAIRSATKQVNDLVNLIHAKIASGELPAGARLRQEQLAKEFAVSRTPVREALRQLETMGVLSHEPGRSVTVRMPSTREVRETYQVRAELEGFAAELAARWIVDDQLAQLQEIHARFRSAVRALRAERGTGSKADGGQSRAEREWIETNDEFHAVIQDAANNRRLVEIIRDLNLGHVRRIMEASSLGMDTYRMQQNIRHHEEILRALKDRDPKAARRAMTDHVLRSSEVLVAWFENRPGRSEP